VLEEAINTRLKLFFDAFWSRWGGLIRLSRSLISHRPSCPSALKQMLCGPRTHATPEKNYQHCNDLTGDEQQQQQFVQYPNAYLP